MATPTFGGIPLTSRAERQTIRGPSPRVAIDTLPGVNGEYVQTHGHGGRTYQITGVMEGTDNATRAIALRQLRNVVIGSIKTLVGTTYAALLDVDGITRDNCVLMAYDEAGDIFIKQGTDPTKWKAGCRIIAIVHDVEQS